MKHKMALLTTDRPLPSLVYNRDYTCHQAVTSATAGARALWVDIERDSHPPLLRVLANGDITAPDGWRLVDTAKYDVASIQLGDRFRFRIRANPVVRREGKRYAVWDGHERSSRESHVEQWLAKRSGTYGFVVTRCVVSDITQVQIRRARNQPSQAAAPPITFAAATLNGMLEVTDPNAFKQALVSGIGPQKAFGCGLLLVKRLK